MPSKSHRRSCAPPDLGLCAAMPGKWLSSCTVPTAKKHLHSFLMTGTNPRRPQPLFGMASSSSVLHMISSAAYGKVRLRERGHWLGLPQTQICCCAGNARSLLRPYAGSRVVEVQAMQVRRNRILVSVPSSEPGEGDRRLSGPSKSAHTSWVCLGLGLWEVHCTDTASDQALLKASVCRLMLSWQHARPQACSDRNWPE